MSNSVKFSVDGETNADQVAGKVKTAVGSIEKQVETIGMKFKNSFKDIFLSFLGPMALLGTAVAFIGKMIEESAKKREDANQAAIDGTNKLMSAEDNYHANKRNNEKKSKEDAEQAKTQRETTTREFMNNDPRGYQVYQDYIAGKIGTNRENPNERNRKFNAVGDAEVQAAVQAIIAEDMKKNPLPAALKDSTFQGPQGFSNVIGVGSNPVLENLTRQTDIQQAILDFIRTPGANSGVTDVDFTKNPIDIRSVS